MDMFVFSFDLFFISIFFCREIDDFLGGGLCACGAYGLGSARLSAIRRARDIYEITHLGFGVGGLGFGVRVF